MKCPNCGYNNYDGVLICKNCGTQLNNPLINNQYNPQPYNQLSNRLNPTMPNIPPVPQINYDNQPQDYNNITIYKKKPPIGKIIGITALVIGIIVVFIFSVYLYLENHGFFDDDSGDEIISTEITNTPTPTKVVEETPTPTPTEVTPTPTIIVLNEKTPTPTPTIVEPSYFDVVVDFSAQKLIGSYNVGYMMVPTSLNLVAVNDTSIQYATDDEKSAVTMIKYNDIVDRATKTNEIIEQIQSMEDRIENITQSGGQYGDYAITQISGYYPDKDVYLVGYTIVYNDNPNVLYWVAIEYTNDNRNEFISIFDSFEPTLKDDIPTELINESDYIG